MYLEEIMKLSFAIRQLFRNFVTRIHNASLGKENKDEIRI